MKPEGLRDISSQRAYCDADGYRRHRATGLFVSGLDAAPSRANVPGYGAHLEAATPFAAASQFIPDGGKQRRSVAWLGEAMMVEGDRTHALNAAAIQAAASNSELDPLTNRVREFRENALLGDVWHLELGLH